MVAFTFHLHTVEAETGGVQQIGNRNGAVFLIRPYGCVTWRRAVKGREGDRERGWACGLEYMTSSYFPHDIFLSLRCIGIFLSLICIGTGSAAELTTQNATGFMK